MAKTRKNKALGFEIDKLTNSIENVVTGDSFATEVSFLSKEDWKAITKKNGWLFNWKSELKYPERKVYKLTIESSPNVIQGLVSLEVKEDHVYMHLIESAPFNLGKDKLYAGVAGNLVAFVCQHSFQNGFAGNILFMAKTQLIEHYSETLGAIHIGRQRMMLETSSALKLINRYFPF